MANNNSDDFDEVDDLDVGGETAGAEKIDAKAGLKQLWEGNPLIKIAAVIVAGGIAYAGYSLVFGGEEEKGEVSIVTPTDTTGTTVAPGTQKLDPVYQKAVETKNEERVKVAQETGGSAIPTAIGTPSSGSIEIPDNIKKDNSDPLAEWRRAAAMSQFSTGQKPEELEDAQQEVVPMAQPAKPQVQAQLDQTVVQGLMEQMRMIISAQEPKDGKNAGVTPYKNGYTLMMEERMAEALARKNGTAPPAGKSDVGGRGSSGGAASVSPAAGGEGGSTAPGSDEDKVVISAGNVSYGQLLNELNSDVEGPALVTILSGPLAGGRAIGKFKLQDEYLTLEFDRIVKDDVSYKVKAIAMDEHTTLTGMQSDVDQHYFKRVILPAAAEFVAGMGEAIAQTSSTTTVGAGGSTATDTAQPSVNEEIFKGVQKSAEKVSDIISKNAEAPVTVKLKKGTTMGILFMDPVKNTDIEK